MSRKKETLDTIENLETALIGNVKKPELYLLPILSEIAISLAVIADKLLKDSEVTE